MEEIDEAILLNCTKGTKKGDYKITSLKETRYGSCTALVTTTRAVADHLVATKRIKIGWTIAQIKLLITPKMCGRCHATDHATSKCTNETPAFNRCWNCGAEGHIAKDCRSRPSCYVCKKEGHRARSMGCQTYRDAVRAEKERRSQMRMDPKLSDELTHTEGSKKKTG